MNHRFAHFAVSVAMAVFLLALFIMVVGGSASNATVGEISFEEESVMMSGTNNPLLTDPPPDISQDETLSLTETISLYLPLLDNEYVKYPAERDALMALYQHTNGDDWINKTGWGTNSSHCDWSGVICDEDGHVIILYLGHNKLSGTIPPEIGNLTQLTKLWLDGTEIVCGKYCRINSYIEGPLPPEIGDLASLQELNLQVNKFTSLPPEIGNLKNLKTLYLNNNQLISLPPEIGNLVNLQELRLEGNHLTSLPREIGNLASLQMLNLDYNRITSLPPEIGNLVNLKGLLLSDIQLKSLPPEITKLKNLKHLELYNNQLSGQIPAWLSNLDNLYSLTLGANPDLTCWETKEARDWALSISYDGPTCYFP